MKKNKIVKFTNGVAKIYIVEDTSAFDKLIDNKTHFLNPDLSHVKGCPPELWESKDGKIQAKPFKKHSGQNKKVAIQAPSPIVEKQEEKVVVVDNTVELRKYVDSLKQKTDQKISALEVSHTKELKRQETFILDVTKQLESSFAIKFKILISAALIVGLISIIL